MSELSITLLLINVIFNDVYLNYLCSLSLTYPQVKTFKDYVELYLRGQSSEDEDELPRKVVHEVVNPRWEVAVTASNGGFQQASFVNSIATTKVRVMFIIRCVETID